MLSSSDPDEIELAASEIVPITPLNNVSVPEGPASRHILTDAVDDDPRELRIR